MNMEQWNARKDEIERAGDSRTGEATGLAKSLSRDVLKEMKVFVRGTAAK